MQTIADLQRRFARPGRVSWIGLRPDRRKPMHSVVRAAIDMDGLAGDHARPGKRALTLIQAEHLRVIEALSEKGVVTPEMLRRNIVVSGLNLAALRGAVVRLGTAQVHITAPCPPCSRMETVLGHGGYTAMRGHGGWCAEVVTPGIVATGDLLEPEHIRAPAPSLH